MQTMAKEVGDASSIKEIGPGTQPKYSAMAQKINTFPVKAVKDVKALRYTKAEWWIFCRLGWIVSNLPNTVGYSWWNRESRPQ